MSNTSENLCYLLWKLNLERERWTRQLAEWAGCEVERAVELLSDAELNDSEQKRIAQILDIQEEELQFRKLIEADRIDILFENVKFLTEQLPHGHKKELAKELGIHPTTITKWLNKEQSPSRIHQEGLRRYFKISSGIDLIKDPIFLSPIPVIDLGRRNWLHQQVNQLSSETLENLFPALVRLLRNT